MISRINSPYQLGRLNQIAKRKGGDVAPWYLAGGISPADCVAAYQAKGAESYAASLGNLTGNATYNLTEVGGTPNWSSIVGWDSDGSTRPLNTNIVPDYGYSYFFRYAGLSDIANIGLYESASQAYTIRIRIVNNDYSLIIGNRGMTASGANASGVIGNAGGALYFNGEHKDAAPISGAGITIPLYVLGRNYATEKAPIIQIQAVAIYSTTLTALQIAALTNAMNEL